MKRVFFIRDSGLCESEPTEVRDEKNILNIGQFAKDNLEVGNIMTIECKMITEEEWEKLLKVGKELDGSKEKEK